MTDSMAMAAVISELFKNPPVFSEKQGMPRSDNAAAKIGAESFTFLEIMQMSLQRSFL